MSSPLEPFFRASYAAYRIIRSLFRFVDLNISVVWAAVRYTGVSLFYLLVVIFIECWTISWVSQCLFPPKEDTLFVALRDFIPVLGEFILAFPILWAFAFFVAGQTGAAYFAFTTVHWLATFKLTYVFGSDEYGRKEAYSPLDGDSSEASESDPLTF